MPLVINSLGGGHTHKHTHTHAYRRAHRNNFKKPGTRRPARAWFKNYDYINTYHYISIKMAPLVKLAVTSKSGEEASFLQKLACLSSSSLHSSRKTVISRVY